MARWHIAFLSMIIYIYSIKSEDTRTELILFTLSNINNGTGSGDVSIAGAQWIAAQEINNRSDLLPNYKLTMKGTTYLRFQYNHNRDCIIQKRLGR